MFNNNQENDVYSRFRKDIYIFHAAPSVFLIILCGITLLFAIKEALKTSSWNIGIGIMIFLGIVFAILAIISMVATYREVSRLHYEEKKEFLNAVDQLLIKLEKLGIKSTGDAEATKIEIDKINKIVEQLNALGITNIDNQNEANTTKGNIDKINKIVDQLSALGITIIDDKNEASTIKNNIDKINKIVNQLNTLGINNIDDKNEATTIKNNIDKINKIVDQLNTLGITIIDDKNEASTI